MSTLGKGNRKKKISKKAMSVIIGYVLLIVIAAVMGVIVYKWQKTYTPQDPHGMCPDESSLMITSLNYDCDNDVLTFELKNTGQFSIGGYFVYVKDNPEKQIATVDISRNNTDEFSPMLHQLGINGIKLGIDPEDPRLTQENDFLPGEVETERYTMVGVPKPIYTLEIVPIVWKKDKGKIVIASCKEIRIVEKIPGCTQRCIPEDPCGDRECGKMLNNCYQEVTCGTSGGSCGVGDFCDSTGHCVTPVDCTQTCAGLNYECGSVCGKSCGSLGGACPTGERCESGTCVTITSTCNGIWEPGEESPGIECDGPGPPAHCVGCVCSSGYDGDGTGGCIEESSGGSGGYVNSCPTWCAAQPEYNDGQCKTNPSRCQSDHGGTVVPKPDGWTYSWCENPTSYCCCYNS